MEYHILNQGSSSGEESLFHPLQPAVPTQHPLHAALQRRGCAAAHSHPTTAASSSVITTCQTVVLSAQELYHFLCVKYTSLQICSGTSSTADGGAGKKCTAEAAKPTSTRFTYDYEVAVGFWCLGAHHARDGGRYQAEP